MVSTNNLANDLENEVNVTKTVLWLDILPRNSPPNFEIDSERRLEVRLPTRTSGPKQSQILSDDLETWVKVMKVYPVANPPLEDFSAEYEDD